MCRPFEDPAVVLVGKRVRGRAPARICGGSRRTASGLPRSTSVSDRRRCGLGPRWHRLPSVCLLPRTEVMRAVSGFEVSLRSGRTRNLVWRLVASGHTWCATTRRTRPRTTLAPQLRGWLGRQLADGSGSATFGRRHGAVVAGRALTSDSLPSGPCSCADPRPAGGVGRVLWSYLILRRTLPRAPGAGRVARRLSTRGLGVGAGRRPRSCCATGGRRQCHGQPTRLPDRRHRGRDRLDRGVPHLAPTLGAVAVALVGRRL